MSQLVPQSLTHAFDFDQALNRDNPRSLINIVPSAMAERLGAIPSDLFEMDIKQLKEKISDKNMENVELLRTAWWIEYNRAQKTQTKFMLSNVYGGITFVKNFLKTYAGNSFCLLYIITPPVDYQIQQHRIMQLAHEQEIKILQMPIMKAVYNKDGDMIGEEIDSKLLAVQQKISESMRNRVQGMPINRTMQVNQNINGPIPNGGPNGMKPLEQMDENELKEFVSELKGEKGIEGTSPRFVDVGDKKK